eukprot:SAG31_NODE_698_length_12746_cov_3.495136_7_plen_200_part_00
MKYSMFPPPPATLPAMHLPSTPQWWSKSFTHRPHVEQWCANSESHRHTRHRTQYVPHAANRTFFVSSGSGQIPARNRSRTSPGGSGKLLSTDRLITPGSAPACIMYKQAIAITAHRYTKTKNTFGALVYKTAMCVVIKHSTVIPMIQHEPVAASVHLSGKGEGSGQELLRPETQPSAFSGQDEDSSFALATGCRSSVPS